MKSKKKFILLAIFIITGASMFYVFQNESKTKRDKLIELLEGTEGTSIGYFSPEAVKALPDFIKLKVQKLSSNKRIQFLEISDTNFSDFKLLEELTELEELNLIGMNLDSLDFLKPLVNLKTLCLSESRIKDFSALGQIPSVNSLNLSGTNFEDVEMVKNLTDLGYLNLSQTKTAEIGALSKLENLMVLDLSGTNIVDIKPLFQNQNLRELDLNNTHVFKEDIKIIKFKNPFITIKQH